MSDRPRRYGARTFGLILCAWIWLFLGLVSFGAPATPRPGVLHLMLPGWVRLGVWVAFAIYAFVSALRAKGTNIALGVLMFPPAATVASYTWGIISAWLLGPAEGYIDGWKQAALYGSCIGIVVLAALHPNRPQPKIHEVLS